MNLDLGVPRSMAKFKSYCYYLEMEKNQKNKKEKRRTDASFFFAISTLMDPNQGSQESQPEQ